MIFMIFDFGFTIYGVAVVGLGLNFYGCGYRKLYFE